MIWIIMDIIAAICISIIVAMIVAIPETRTFEVGMGSGISLTAFSIYFLTRIFEKTEEAK